MVILHFYKCKITYHLIILVTAFKVVLFSQVYIFDSEALYVVIVVIVNQTRKGQTKDAALLLVQRLRLYKF